MTLKSWIATWLKKCKDRHNRLKHQIDAVHANPVMFGPQTFASLRFNKALKNEFHLAELFSFRSLSPDTWNTTAFKATNKTLRSNRKRAVVLVWSLAHASTLPVQSVRPLSSLQKVLFSHFNSCHHLGITGLYEWPATPGVSGVYRA